MFRIYTKQSKICVNSKGTLRVTVSNNNNNNNNNNKFNNIIYII